jgi:methionine sulfoxide reductase heme-binding subunit
MTFWMAGNGFSSNPLWYLTRSTGVVAFVLLTLGTVLGVAATQRALASPGWPRFATQVVHRNVNLLALAFVVVHFVTTLLDGYVSVGVAAVLVPFVSSYRAVAVAWGTLAFDLLLLVAITGLIRIRMREPVWRLIHLTAYLAWPLALAHFIATGTDGAFAAWGFWLGVVCALCVTAAGYLRLSTRGSGPQGPVRSVAGRT